jgi:type I restriction-modification system DNA methylase subunit
MMAEMTLGDVGSVIAEKGFVTICEPAAGAGGMVLAAADVLAGQGYDPGLHMLVQAIDVSPLCYHMAFLQLSWRGIPALVQRANSLSRELFEEAWTFAVEAFEDFHTCMTEPEPDVEIEPPWHLY